MNSDFHTATTDTATRAKGVLDDLMARVGVDGLTAALTSPGLMAAVDQHAAAVREAVRRSGRRVSLHTLASYASSVVAAVYRAGRALPEPGDAQLPVLDWNRAEWHLLRLLGVCAIAEERGLL